MDKQIRKAVRCYLIKDEKVVVTKYKEENKKMGYSLEILLDIFL